MFYPLFVRGCTSISAYRHAQGETMRSQTSVIALWLWKVKQMTSRQGSMVCPRIHAGKAVICACSVTATVPHGRRSGVQGSPTPCRHIAAWTSWPVDQVGPSLLSRSRNKEGLRDDLLCFVFLSVSFSAHLWAASPSSSAHSTAMSKSNSATASLPFGVSSEPRRLASWICYKALWWLKGGIYDDDGERYATTRILSRGRKLMAHAPQPIQSQRAWSSPSHLALYYLRIPPFPCSFDLPRIPAAPQVNGL